MIITGKSIPRRMVLRGLGASLALPLLDGMVPAFASTRAAAPIKRLGVVYVPNGMMMPDWTPAAEGKDFAYTRILKALEPYREQIQLLSGMHGVEGAGPHLGQVVTNGVGQYEVTIGQALHQRRGTLVAASGSHGRFLVRVRKRAVDAAGAPARFLEVAAEAPLGRGLYFFLVVFLTFG